MRIITLTTAPAPPASAVASSGSCSSRAPAMMPITTSPTRSRISPATIPTKYSNCAWRCAERS
jgi:hypothetical protein